MAPPEESSSNKILVNEEDFLQTRISDSNYIKLETNSRLSNKTYKWEIVWPRAIILLLINVGTLYGFYIIFTENEYFLGLCGFLLGLCSTLGVTGGAHRLWTHRAYKAKWPMRIMLMLMQTMAYQNSIYEWVRDHRVHHKFTDTDADPHNSRRGFFFSHMGWLMIKKHPDVKLKGKTIDMSDIEADPIVMFQKKYFKILMPTVAFILPTILPALFWGYSLRKTFFICSIVRYNLSLHGTWCVNSAAHLWGYKPYDKSINPSDNRFVIVIGIGEGYHNYHHVFPWDYKAAEMGSYFFNLTKVMIDTCAKIGWAYDMKTVSVDMIRKRILRTGDGSHSFSKDAKKYEDLLKELNHEKEEQYIWGWDDKDMTKEDKEDTNILNKGN